MPSMPPLKRLRGKRMDLGLARQWMDAWFEQLNAQKNYLSELDNPIGDGDHGINMARGANAAKDALADKEIPDLNTLFKTIAMALLSKVGGASGPLYGSIFLAFAKASADHDMLDHAQILALLNAGKDALMSRGKAEVGEKTMVDVWVPFTEKFVDQAPSKGDVDAMVEATKPLKATKGRAAYLGERSIGHIDPGSMSTGYLFKALLGVLAS